MDEDGYRAKETHATQFRMNLADLEAHYEWRLIPRKANPCYLDEKEDTANQRYKY